jgi:hypothetical protein
LGLDLSGLHQGRNKEKETQVCRAPIDVDRSRNARGCAHYRHYEEHESRQADVALRDSVQQIVLENRCYA